MKNFSRWNWLGVGVIALAVLLAFSSFFRSATHSAASAKEDHASGQNDSSSVVRVEVTTPKPGGIERKSTQPGSVMSFESAELFAKVSGYLKLQTVDIGSRVKRGELLVEIDAPEFARTVDQRQAELDQAQAQVAQAQARILSAEADRDATLAGVKQAEAEVDKTSAVRAFREKQHARIKHLFDLKSIDERLVDEKLDEMEGARAAERAAEAAVLNAKAQVTAASAKVDRTRADLEESKANVEVAQAALEKAKVFVEYTRIISPYDGVITKRNFFRGDFIRSPDQGGIVPLLAVSRTDLMRVVVQVPDRDVPFTAVGNEAKIEIDALPGIAFSGKVSRMADAEDHKTRTMRTEIDLPNPDNTLRDGMYGGVTIRLMQGIKALTIPSSALAGEVDGNGNAHVFVVEDNKARLKRVHVGTDDGLRIEVLKGITEKDQVVFRHRGTLADGAPVEVNAPEDSS